VVTVIDCVVAPVDQTFPKAALLVRITLPPTQNVVGPLAVILGIGGDGLIVTDTGSEVSDTHVPLSV
jgi:hypothetical protein